MTEQLFDNPKVLYLAGAVIGLIGLIPGMPNMVFLLFSSMCIGIGWLIQQRQAAEDNLILATDSAATNASNAQALSPSELTWDEVTPLDVIGLEVGYRLIPLVDRAQGGELIGRITGVRKKLSKELGFLLQSVHIRDNLELLPTGYRITLLGDTVGQGEVMSGMELAINPGQVHGLIHGTATKDPAFGMEAVWIEPRLRDDAQAMGYTVVDIGTVIATHLSQVLKTMRMSY